MQREPKPPQSPPGERVVALLTADWHLSHWKPSARADVDWYATQAGYLKQLVDLLPSWEVPIIVAGDLVDKWNQPSEWTNWAFNHVPGCWAVPGQHDLPLHNADDLHKSAFQTLVEMGRVRRLSPRPETFLCPNQVNLRVYGFGWGEKAIPPLPRDRGFKYVDLAVVHRYVWSKEENAYPGAPAESHFKRFKELEKYDVVLSGDNHKGFLLHSDSGRWWLNPGTFIRRKADEINHRPCVGLLFADGSIKRHRLDVSGDRFVDRPEKAEGDVAGLEEFVAGLRDLEEGEGLDFEKAMRHALRGERITKVAREMILKAMEGKTK